MKFSPGQVLAHLSRSEHLYPGELIASGTLPGGSGMELGRWIQPGDHLRLLIDGVGEIEHSIV
jgi:2-keto-4-pentenoate hydratase/2-oxohepta-3-ene-1,7-dioic acid hydratase in catechol pathway